MKISMENPMREILSFNNCHLNNLYEGVGESHYTDFTATSLGRVNYSHATEPVTMKGL